MATFLYFAYGSNMLSERLRARCPSARVEGSAVAKGFRLCFDKRGLGDGSGKAMLGPTRSPSDMVHGVIYRIDLAERPVLDGFEGGYLRDDAFEVTALGDGALQAVTTYVARAEHCQAGLRPFDWYLALIRAGARQHRLDPAYVAVLDAVAAVSDPWHERPERLAALRLIRGAG